MILPTLENGTLLCPPPKFVFSSFLFHFGNMGIISSDAVAAFVMFSIACASSGLLACLKSKVNVTQS